MNKAEIEVWLRKYNTFNHKCEYTINNDMTIDVKGDVELMCLNGNIPEGIKFNKIKGDFLCIDCSLTSLIGCPEEVSNSFNCSWNKLTSLEGAPKKVGIHFGCSDNELTTLENSPEVVGSNFYCYNNKLTSLKGCTKEIGGGFSCFENKLTTLEGGPKKVGTTYNCENNSLTSLIGIAEVVGKIIKCSHNPLTTLKYLPFTKSVYINEFSDDEIQVEQEIMKNAKTYEEGLQAYQEYLDIFGDD